MGLLIKDIMIILINIKNDKNGIIGNPIKHSLSNFIIIIKQIQYRCKYSIIDVKENEIESLSKEQK